MHTSTTAGSHRTEASGGTPWRRGPSAPGSRSSRDPRARVGQQPSGLVSGSVVRRRSERGCGRCWCRQRRRRARRRTPAPPEPCRDRFPEVRAAPRDRRATLRRGVTRPPRRRFEDCAPASDTPGPARGAGHHPATPMRTPPGRGRRGGTPSTSGSPDRPGSVAASPRRRGSTTDRASPSTAGRAAAAHPTRGRRRRRSSGAARSAQMPQSAQTSVPS